MYEYEFSALSGSAESGDQPAQSGNPFGGNPFEFNPFAQEDTTMTDTTMTENNGATGDQAVSANGEEENSESSAQFEMSPFGRLLGLPGVDGVEDIFGNVGIPGEDSSGDGDTAPVNDNPFERFNPLEDGNPFVEGDEPDLEDAPFSTGNPFAESTLAQGNEVTVALEDAYMLSDGEGNWYLSEDDAISDGDTLLSSNGMTADFSIEDWIDGAMPSGTVLAGGSIAGDNAIALGTEEDGYLLRDEEGNWYFSEDDTVSDDDPSLWSSGLAEDFNVDELTGISFPILDGPFAGSEVTFDLEEEGYLLTDEEGNWYLSADDAVDEGDMRLFGGSNPFADDGNPFTEGEVELPFPVPSFSMSDLGSAA